MKYRMCGRPPWALNAPVHRPVLTAASSIPFGIGSLGPI